MSTSSTLAEQWSERLTALWIQTRRWLRYRGFLPAPDRAFEQVEGRLAQALPLVEASPAFRQSLASNLALMAQHHRAGVIVAPQHNRQQALLISLGIATLATAGVATLVALCRTQSGSARLSAQRRRHSCR
ncbi:MAG: hypothetical protein ACOX2L_10220 [Anaerolineae bacterium]|jgi:hypothetical protein|nr:hypothetical protein [Chloroflexota bacterium]